MPGGSTVKTFVYVKKKAVASELKHDEIESADTCGVLEVIASSSGIEVVIWLRYCATSPKVAGSIPDGVIGVFHWHILSGLTMALRSTQPPTEMSARNISWG
jgi:hypothetical protein